MILNIYIYVRNGILKTTILSITYNLTESVRDTFQTQSVSRDS